MTASDQLTAAQEAAYYTWLAMAQRAAETKSLADMIASGEAFGRFHFLFVESGRRSAEILPLLGRPVSSQGDAA